MAGLKIRQTSPLVDGSIRLCCRVNHLKSSSIVTMSYVLYPGEWDDVTEQILIGAATPRQRREELEQIREKVMSDKKRMRKLMVSLAKHGLMKAKQVTDAFRKQSEMTSFVMFMRHIIEEAEGKKREPTVERYKSVFRSFREILPKGDIALESITVELLHEYVNHLTTVRKVKGCTIKSYLNTLHTVWRRAVIEGILPYGSYSPFKQIEVTAEPAPKRALTEKEKDRLIKVISSLKDPDLRFAGDMFIFSFAARGMPYVDMAFLTKENLVDGYIVYKRHKTNQEMRVKITDRLKALIDKYQSPHRKYLFPILQGSNPGWKDYQTALRVQNNRLKRIAAKAKLDPSRLSTYVARHTWASIAKQKGVPDYVISDSLGHTSLRTTRYYISTFHNDEVDEANDAVVEKKKRGKGITKGKSKS